MQTAVIEASQTAVCIQTAVGSGDLDDTACDRIDVRSDQTLDLEVLALAAKIFSPARDCDTGTCIVRVLLAGAGPIRALCELGTHRG